MGTGTGVKYIGKNDVYEDNILRTGLTWSKGETHILPEVMAKEFLKHPGMFAEVPGASYLIAGSSAQGIEIKGELAAGIARSLLIASEPPAGVDRYGPVTYSATIKNPLAVARPLEPVAIRVRFPKGAAVSPDYIRVRDGSGAYASWQWEPEYHTRTGADISTWPDGSLRAGCVWVAATLGASETQLWAVEVYAEAQSNSFAAAVAYSIVDAGLEKVTANGIEYGFTGARGWLLESCTKLSIPYNYLLTGGASASFSVGATPYSTTTIANVNLVSHADVTPGANKGVVFRDFQTVMTWAVEANAKATVTHRIFANGTCRITWRWDATGAITAGATTRTFAGRIDLNQSATSTKPFDSDLMYTARYYSAGQSVAIGCNATQQTSDAQETPFDKSFSVADYRQILGWATKTSTAALAAGASCYVWTWITPDCGAAAELTNVVDVANNPVYVFAEQGARNELRARVASSTSRLLSRWLEYQPSEVGGWPASQGFNFLFDHLRTGNVTQLAAAKAKLTDWLTITQNPTASADVWFAKWLASSPTQTSIAYMGRESLLPYFLWLATGEPQYAQIVHAAADFAVKVEQWCKSPAGGNVAAGSVFLFPGDNNPINASASVLGMIAQSLSIISDPTRLACAQEILAYVNSSVTHKLKLPYKIAPAGTQNGVKFLQKITYFRRAVWDVVFATRIAPSIGAFNIDPIPFLAESHTATGQADETKWTTERNRRGLLPLEAVGIAVFDGSRQGLALADALTEHAEAVTTPAGGLSWPVDGWNNSETQAQNLGQNIQSVLAALLLTA